MAYYDLREYLGRLEREGLLHHVEKPVDKGWEISAVCRQAFVGIPEEQRPALSFDAIQGYPHRMVAGIFGASRRIYALALETKPEHITEKWEAAQAHPVAPVLVEEGPCQEEVLLGDAADLTRFPWPVWTVGEDPGPYITAGFVVTKDVRTGVRNVGTYRQQIKGPRKTGMQIGTVHDAYRQILNNDEVGEPTPIAIVMGTDPTIGLCSVTNFPYGVDEFAIAGGLRGEPVPLVRCKTVDLEVPATAELVIEGLIPARKREREGPFGEFTGYMSPPGEHFIVEVTAITHRHQPVLQAFVSQMPPSESSVIRGTAHEQTLLRHLKETLRLPVIDLHCLAAGGTDAYIVVSMKKNRPGQVKQVIFAVWSFEPRQGKIVVVVDEDINPRDAFQVNWALSFRMQPAQDVFIVDKTAAVANDPSTAPPDVEHHLEGRLWGSKMGIDATKKFTYPPIALPPQEHVDTVAGRWHEYGF